MGKAREHKSESTSPGVTRRGFFAQGMAAAAGASAVAAALSPLRHLTSDDIPTIEEFFQKHYKEMTDEDKQEVFARIRAQVAKRYGAEPNLADPAPLDGVEFVYGLNLSRCITSFNCRR